MKNKLLKLFAVTVLVAFSFPVFAQNYIGNLSNNPYAPNSLGNRYGAGNPHNPSSPTNPYSQNSFNNPYGNDSNSPKAYDSQGNFRGT
jgi:hypothetical protein